MQTCIADCWQNPYPHPHPILAAQNRPAPIQQQLRPTKLRQQRQCCFQDWGGHLRTGQGHVPWQFWNHNGCFDDLWFMMIYDDLWWFGKYKMDQNAWHFDPTCFFAPSPTETPFLSLRLYFFPTPHWGPLFQSLFTVFLVPSNIETLCLSLCLRFLGSKPHREPLFKPVFALFLAACPTETPCLRWLSLCLQFLYLLFFFGFFCSRPHWDPLCGSLCFSFFSLSAPPDFLCLLWFLLPQA